MRLVAGIFVGGRGTRMGGVAKGLLTAPDGQPIVVRARRLLEGLGAECVLVGSHPAYADVGLPVVADDPIAEGPLAGLLALLAHAGDRPALALACDMPFVDAPLLRRLVVEQPGAPVLAPRRPAGDKGRDVWEPLCARYQSREVLSVARTLAEGGERRLQRILDVVGARALRVSPEEERALEDWDALPAGPAHDKRGP